jgi:hypothetical protein
MRSIYFAGISVLLVAGIGFAQTMDSSKEPADKTSIPAGQKALCLLSGAPPPTLQYTVVKKLTIGKGSYGSVSDVLPKLVKKARNLGAGNH